MPPLMGSLLPLKAFSLTLFCPIHLHFSHLLIFLLLKYIPLPLFFSLWIQQTQSSLYSTVPLCPPSQDPTPRQWHLDTQTAPWEGAGVAACSSGTTLRMRCWSCHQPRALWKPPELVTLCLETVSTQIARAGRLLEFQSQVLSSVNEEIKAQRGEETCQRSHSKWLQSWD